MKDSLGVRFTVVYTKEFGGRRYFTTSEVMGITIKLFNLPPFPELIGSTISVFSPKTPEQLPRVCCIDLRVLPQIPREHSVRTCFDEWIPGILRPLSSLEAMWLDVGDSFTIMIPQKSGIVSHADFEKFLKVKYFTVTESELSILHEKFKRRILNMGKESFNGEEVLEHFSFPEILSFPW
jgi:hypothetical protein